MGNAVKNKFPSALSLPFKNLPGNVSAQFILINQSARVAELTNE